VSIEFTLYASFYREILLYPVVVIFILVGRHYNLFQSRLKNLTTVKNTGI